MADSPNDVQGLPPGATLKPIGSQPVDDPSQVQGLPPGATLQPLGSSATTAAAPPPGGILSDIGDVAKGIGEGAVSAMGSTIQALPYVGKKIITPEAMAAERAAFAPGSTAEKLGQYGGEGAESVVEFVLGDEALKGLALADKVGLAGEITKIMKTSPYIGKLLEHGVNAARMGTVGATQALARGATLPQAAVTGAATGVGGESLSAVSEPLIKGLKNPFRTAKSVAAKFTGSDIQPTLKSGIQDVWNEVADKAGVARPTTKSVQDLGQEVGDKILARSKANYRLIDDATGNRFSGTEKAIRDVNDALRDVTNDTDEGNLMVRKQRLEMQMDQMMDEAQSKGVDKNVIKAAKDDFKQAQAIYDTNAQIRRATTGVRPGMQGSAQVPEEVNPKNLMNKLNTLSNKGRLQQAVGQDSAEDIIGHTAIAQKAAKDAARNSKVAKTVAGVVGVPAVGTAVVEGVRQMMEH